MKIASALIITLTLLGSLGTAHAQTPSPAEAVEPTIEIDRPDVTNGVETIPPGRVQIETGGLFVEENADDNTFFAPITFRFGLNQRVEARLETNGVVSQTLTGTRTTGFGNLAIGAKIRIWEPRGHVPALSIVPSVTLPTASEDKGLGSGDPDYTLALLTGFDVGTKGRLDVNYRVGAIGAGGGESHFAQHLVSASADVNIGSKWNPYAEIYWASRDEPDGNDITAFDGGVLYAIRPRLVVDAGIQIGISRGASDFGVFSGISFQVGRSNATSASRQVRDRD